MMMHNTSTTTTTTDRWNSFVITFRRPIVSSLLLSPNRRGSSWVSRSGRNRGSPRSARRWWNTALPSFLWRVSVPLSAAFPRTRPRFSPFVFLERSTLLLLSFAFRNYNNDSEKKDETFWEKKRTSRLWSSSKSYSKKTSSEDNDGEEETLPAKSSSSSKSSSFLRLCFSLVVLWSLFFLSEKKEHEERKKGSIFSL